MRSTYTGLFTAMDHAAIDPMMTHLINPCSHQVGASETAAVDVLAASGATGWAAHAYLPLQYYTRTGRKLSTIAVTDLELPSSRITTAVAVERRTQSRIQVDSSGHFERAVLSAS
jgi:hypothetical protein